MAYAYNPSTLGGQGRRSLEPRSSNQLGQLSKTHLLKKYKNWLGMVVLTYSPNYLGAGRWEHHLSPVSCNHTTAFQPRQQSKIPSL